ncbi:ATP-binding protein [Streptomyces sp. CBMA152]|uniref:ATP-binding protein n=1 Tax=Streptomyces sp. CBMA152 TaxID=1896312 RepID=UPI0016604A03|nr:ATP-binding protein [Streptomyces sp. CBMA152]MBD0745723.1 hypothetical protein [Streptomyces sp. CBMA152]
MNPQITTRATEFVRRFSSTRRGASSARKVALGQLDAWGVPHGSERSDTAALIVAELAANAVLHGHVPGRDFELRLVLGTVLRIEVTDTRGERVPCVADPGAGAGAGAVGGGAVAVPGVVGGGAVAERGRGLVLVAALALAWGVEERAVGKVVWAEVG